MREHTAQIHRRLVLLELVTLAVALPAIAGAVNAAGFMVVGAYLSHVTGNLARIGDEVAVGRFEVALGYSVIIAAFFGGAVLATVQIEVSKRLNKPRYIAAMLTEGLLLAGFSVLSALTPASWHQSNLLLMCMLSGAMGLQNAMVTRLSGAVVRTTHMTGIVTDIGIETVRLAFEVKDRSANLPVPKKIAALFAMGSDVEARRLRLLTYILLSFFLGAMVGPIVYLQVGYWGAIGPTMILIALGVLDLFVGIEWHPEAHFVPMGRPANAQFLAMVATELERNPEKAKAALDAMRKRGVTLTKIARSPDTMEGTEVVLSPQGSAAANHTPPHNHAPGSESATPAPVPEEAALKPAAGTLEAAGVLKAPHGQAPS
jgi:uncharacterized membrane protein YoaK (UPF0700 family)